MAYHTLNFEPIIECLLLKIVGDPSPRSVVR